MEFNHRRIRGKTYLNKLKDLAVSLNISENIFFEGPIYGSQKVNIISSSDLFVLPTFSENFGIVIAESLSRGAGDYYKSSTMENFK